MLKVMDDIFESFTNLFIEVMLNIGKFPYPNYVSVIKSQCMDQRLSTNATNL